MERYFRHGPSEEMRKLRATRVLELNADHRSFQVLKAAWENDKDKAARLARILYALSELTAGVEVEEPAQLAQDVAELF